MSKMDLKPIVGPTWQPIIADQWLVLHKVQPPNLLFLWLPFPTLESIIIKYKQGICPLFVSAGLPCTITMLPLFFFLQFCFSCVLNNVISLSWLSFPFFDRVMGRKNLRKDIQSPGKFITQTISLINSFRLMLYLPNFG